VGFVSDLPHELVAAFRATLEEVLAADLVIHVRDISHPDAEAQAADVEGVLRELGLAEVVDRGLVEALNKIDRLDAFQRDEIVNQAQRRPDAIALSAATGEGIDTLCAEIDRRLGAGREVADLSVPLSDGAGIAWLYRRAEVIARRDDAETAFIRVRIDPADIKRFHQRLGRGGGR
jgi:GTP-binding protein HflX